MGLRQRIWARKAAEKLKIEMGGRCVDCGETDLAKLQFDHLQPRTWKCLGTELSHQISIYRREWREGLLQLLCQACNKKKGEPVGATSESDEPIPD